MSLASRSQPSPNSDDRPPAIPIDTIVLHYTGMQSAAAAITRLCDPASKVSAHYVVEQDGTLWQLVDERRRAFHAGVSSWRGISAQNDRSIGIEIVNPGHEWGYQPFPAAQIGTVLTLCQDMMRRHPIEPRNVVAHSDIAPNRKQDPGELFPWALLAAEGIGLWPEAPTHAVPEQRLAGLLGAIGYDTALDGVVAAFQRHWRPARVDGIADRETGQTAWAVLQRIAAS